MWTRIEKDVVLFSCPKLCMRPVTLTFVQRVVYVEDDDEPNESMLKDRDCSGSVDCGVTLPDGSVSDWGLCVYPNSGSKVM